MTDEVRPLSRRKLIVGTVGAALAAFTVLFAGVIPAEFGRDPLGLGKAAGTLRLWAPDETAVDVNAASGPLARQYDIPLRNDVIEIPLGGFLEGASRSELEYKVAMREGATLIYSWEVIGAARPDDLRYDFHGHTTPTAKGEGMTVATYKQGYGLKQEGALTAPFAGIQGWQFSNSAESPVVVRVRLTGFYELVPPGRPGNEAGILANRPAAQSRPRGHAAAD